MITRRQKFLLAAVLLVALAALLGHMDRVAKARRARQTGSAAVTLVKREEGCVMCGSTVGYIAEEVTYSFVVNGVSHNAFDVYECSARECSRRVFPKVCYDPDKPDEYPTLVDADARCGAE
ncbi:MAG TPA: hypothetical protein VGB98_25400 [Pyrinomonadaceae bacterium]|jgi:hypothetical protein